MATTGGTLIKRTKINGLVSEHITSVCQLRDISIQQARLRTGRDKGPIEGFFGLCDGLLQLLPGHKEGRTCTHKA
ncbi:hypothetical protein B1H19_01315 [Streptomyces gilvosporeus]|uniref:Uncharacterized protein n=1 Tax=Streptomyces gilvosporeus TaxID=553510 RepID=A0A1V0TJ91_9ACTN|nr:hypothetical protein B1H19_01315 [Streptomyces gilvosporeus]